MNDRINTLDELLSDPMIKLVMERDRVQPAALRTLLEEKVRRAEDDAPVNPDRLVPPAHMVAETCHKLWLCS
ncbi:MULTISPECIES: hypothetical protein [unclassified Mesorhizobium]|uniref:hypothetical protein n=1 Tax=unclassified Mesorhizobium TaxID=325217 RepID=UPI000FD27FCF|nr:MULTISPECIES: hypothetical protein [unclassified Mesorhizobium]RVB71825.1 hypothetical protein EN885_31350 [Mesorhizobium sp. M6A.T.Cr.TU.014.01.1.1]RWP70124.1 MAG: hypothetical protein EOR10_32210 [Mesorhizobium sp.]RWQ02798.1 MAG: hypothetical protein EOR90_19340 [Mesorhizobium sp.]RWQ08344.1 MAG: hypothetical protein EOR91_10260 [Mesorhizobium sp.]